MTARGWGWPLPAWAGNSRLTDKNFSACRPDDSRTRRPPSTTVRDHPTGRKNLKRCAVAARCRQPHPVFDVDGQIVCYLVDRRNPCSQPTRSPQPRVAKAHPCVHSVQGAAA